MNSERTEKIAGLLDLLNINSVTYQMINKHEFGKTYIKASILSRDLNNTFLSLFYTVYPFDESTGYFDLGDDVYITFDELYVNVRDEEITFAQRFIKEYCDEIVSADCVGGNVNVFMKTLPSGIGKYIGKSQKTIGKDFVRYTMRRDKRMLTISVPRNKEE